MARVATFGFICALLVASTMASAMARAAAPGSEPLIAELRVGVLDHASTLFSSGREGGVDLNLELVFRRLPFLWGPHPYIGVSGYTDEDTDQLYAGLGWRWHPGESLFLGLGVGAAVHNGEILRVNDDVRGLGNRVLIHLAAEAGWRLSRRYDIALYYQHISNGPFHGQRGVNDGLDNIGLRLGYHF